MATLDVCIRHRATRTTSGLVSDSGDGYASRRFRKRPGAARERHDLSASLPLADARTFQALIERVGFHVPFGMTVPGDASARAWRLVSVRERWTSAIRADFDFTVEHVAGVDVPT